MRHLKFLLFVMTVLVFSSYQEPEEIVNPFFTEYKTPFQVPPFDQIKITDYMPAFDQGIKDHDAEIKSIVDNPDPPDFLNTINAFDKSGKLLMKVSKVFFNLNEANTNKEMQLVAKEVTPMITKHSDDIYLNEKLFDRIRKVYETRTEKGLDPQQIRVTEKYFRDFERRGANLPGDKKDALRKINEELAMLTLSFGENLLAETNDNFLLVLDNEKSLSGLPPDVVEAAAELGAEMASGNFGNKVLPVSSGDPASVKQWVFTLAKPSMIPFLQYNDNRDLREKIYQGYFNRGNNDNENDNKEILKKIANLRLAQANLLGYPDYASYIIEENMAKTPATVYDFLTKLWTAALPVSKKEADEMQKIIDRDGGKFKLGSWDWWYYAEKIRKEKYNLDEGELKPYFSLANVRSGMFQVASKLYAITFTQRTDLPVYHKDVETYEVKEADGRHLGILYLDYFPRDGKRGGAWCTEFRSVGWEDEKRIDPVVSIVCNFTKPTSTLPSLLSWDETTTLFHEFGHALHSLFTQGKYYRTAGNVPTDYVELPSQIMENWAAEPEVLRLYARHYETGEIIPENLITKIQKSSLFNQGFETVEYLAASFLDLDYHTIKESQDFKVPDFEKSAMDKIGLIPQILPRYRSTYFAHIFSGGYAAGYYVYIWAAVLDADAFNAFKKSGDIFDRSLADKFRKYCLAECGDDEGMVQYKKFRGQEPSVEPLLIRRGLK